jgi:pimeloyl-ACP methyl ester carboxylesterase
MKQGLQRDITSTLQDFYRLLFATQEEQSRHDFEQLTFPQPGAQICIQGLDYLMHKDLRACLPLVDKPTLIVHGEQDRITPLAQGEYLHRAIKDSSLEVFQGCGHVPFFSRANIFNLMLEEFCCGC